MRDDDLAPQRVARHVGGELLAQQRREIAPQRLRHPGVLGQLGSHQLVGQPHLAVGQQHRQLGAGEARAACLAFVDLLVGGQVLDGPVQAAGLFQEADEACLLIDQGHAHAPGQRQRLGLEVVVAQHQRGHVVGHPGQQRVALLRRHLAVTDGQAEQDLDVDLVVRGVDAGGVVDRVGVDAHAGQRRLDAPALREAEVAAFGHHLAAQRVAVDAQGIVGAVTDIGMRLAAGLDVGADAAVVEKVDRGPEDRAHEFGGAQPLGRDAQHALRLRRDRDRLLGPRPYAAAGGDELRVVVRPRRTRQLEQALALGERGCRVGFGVDEDVAVVEGGHEPDVARQQHAVAEHVARHVADADHRELAALGVEVDFAEVALHALPGAARGDAHHLVVVAHAATRGEGVAQPVLVFGADGVGVVRESGRALVGGDHQIGVVVVQAHGLRRRHGLAADQVVGEVEQRAQVVLVAGHPLLEVGLAVSGLGRPLEHETALAAHRHDDRVLHHLRLHQAQHFGTEVLGAVRPAQAAAGDLAAAQVDALEARRVDEDLVQRPRFGQAGHAGRVELEAQEAAPRAARARAADAGAPEVRAQRGQHQCDKLAQHAVVLQVADLLQRLFDAVDLRGGAQRVVPGRVQAQPEQAHQHARDARMRGQRGLDRGLRQRKADLPEVLGVGAQDHDLVAGQAGAQHEPVEVVVLGLAVEDAGEGLLEAPRHQLGLDVGADGGLQFEVVQRDRCVRGRAVGHRPACNAVIVLAEHAHAHVLEHRQAVGQNDSAAAPIDLEAQRAGLRAQRPRQGQRQRRLDRERVDLQHVGHRRARVGAFAVAGREAGAPALEQFEPAAFADGVDQRVAQLVVPAPRGRGEPGFELLDVHLRHLPGRGAHGEVDAGQDDVAELDVELGAGAGVGGHQDALEADAQLGRIGFARRIDQARNEAVEGVAADEEAQPLPLAQRQDAQRRLVEFVVGDLEQVVARVGLEDVVQGLGQVPARRQAGAAGDGLHLAAQQWRLRHARAVGGGSEQADETVLANHLAGGVVALDADVIGVAGAVHGGARVGLGDDQHRQGAACQRTHIGRQRREAGRLPFLRRFAQHAPAAGRHQAQGVLAALVDEVVAAVAQQRHVVVGQPAQEGHAFAHLRRGQRGRRGFEFIGRGAQLRQHRLPVFDRRAHVGQHTRQAGHQLGALLRVDHAVDLDVHPRFVPRGGARGRVTTGLDGDQPALAVAFDGEDRVHDQVQRQTLAVDLHRRGVDEEGHVVVDDVDHRVPRRPSVFSHRRAEGPHEGLPAAALGAELPVRQQRAEQVVGRGVEQVVGLQTAEVLAPEGLHQRLLRGLHARGGQAEHGVDAFAAGRFVRGGHRGISFICCRWRAGCRGGDRACAGAPGGQAGTA